MNWRYRMRYLRDYQAEWVRQHRGWLMVLRGARQWPRGLKAGGWR